MTTNRLHPIDLSPLIDGLEQPLQLVSDPEARERLQAYVNAARPQVERAAFDILSGVVGTFNEAGTDQRARLEYANGALHLLVEETQESQAEPSFNDGDLERVTLRLPKALKELIDVAAQRHGMSANTWYVRALSRAVARQARDAGEQGAEGRHDRRWRGFYRGRGGRHGFPGDGGE